MFIELHFSVSTGGWEDAAALGRIRTRLHAEKIFDESDEPGVDMR
ncbi:hypothetical protein [Umezawaea sp. Da 62-37]|nr:hypothetical protein [Umezawaea sp. Da 62-37]WNV90973.1 hypothetical protein RM788_22640 [Umezawaea sp. Da 62-37]